MRSGTVVVLDENEEVEAVKVRAGTAEVRAVLDKNEEVEAVRATLSLGGMGVVFLTLGTASPSSLADVRFLFSPDPDPDPDPAIPPS